MRGKILSLITSKVYLRSSITHFWSEKNKIKQTSKKICLSKSQAAKERQANYKIGLIPTTSICKKNQWFRILASSNWYLAEISKILLRLMEHLVQNTKIYSLEPQDSFSTLKANQARKIQVMVRRWPRLKWQRNSFNIYSSSNSNRNRYIHSQFKRMVKLLLLSLWDTSCHKGRKKKETP